MSGPWYSVTHLARPFTTNEERKWVPRERAAHVREWRSAFFWLAKQARIPRLGRVEVLVVPRGSRADIGGVLPAAKAGIDGLVDAGVLADDDPTHLVLLTFAPSEPGPPALELRLREVGEQVDPP